MIVPYRRDLWFGVLLQAKETRNMQIESIAVGYNPPVDINVVVEIPMGGEPIKYELDKRSGRLFVDRFLYTPVTYPATTASCRTLSASTTTRLTFWFAVPTASCQVPSSTAVRSVC
jgi:hypothetical protein